MQKSHLRHLFYCEKNYIEIINNFNTTDEPCIANYVARSYLELLDFKKAAMYFSKAGLLYEQGRCELLQGNINNCTDIWSQIKEESSILFWGRSLLQFINLYVVDIPTFFQIRAFLEVDLDALIKARLITYAENVANGAHIFARNNQESFKFVGRVFVNNSYFDIAELFLNQAKDICYADPEVHFLLAKCHINGGNLEKAKTALNTSIEKGYGYYPAKKLLEKINTA